MRGVCVCVLLGVVGVLLFCYFVFISFFGLRNNTTQGVGRIFYINLCIYKYIYISYIYISHISVGFDEPDLQRHRTLHTLLLNNVFYIIYHSMIQWLVGGLRPLVQVCSLATSLLAQRLLFLE